MPVFIALQMYPVVEVCGKLADMKERNKPYDRQQVDAWIKEKLPTAQMIGGRYMLTDTEIEWLAKKIRVTKKRAKMIDK